MNNESLIKDLRFAYSNKFCCDAVIPRGNDKAFLAGTLRRALEGIEQSDAELKEAAFWYASSLDIVHYLEEEITRLLAVEIDKDAEISRLAAGFNKAMEAVSDYVNYEHDGDPNCEDRRAMGEMLIDDMKRSGDYYQLVLLLNKYKPVINPIGDTK